MNRTVLLLLVEMILFSCNEKEKKATVQETELLQTDSVLIKSNKLTKSGKIVERYFPEEKETNRFDTIIFESSLKISIIDNTLDSYVTNEFESDGISYIDKYRDNEKHLIIELSNKIIIDTIFRKENFVDYAGQDFLDISNFHGYWFNKVDNESIELFGVINKPETDWSYDFYHYFDWKTKKFKIEEYIDEEI